MLSTNGSLANLRNEAAFEFYRDFVEFLCKYYNGNYLEIGCYDAGLTCRVAKHNRTTVGVDIIAHPLWAGYLAQYPQVTLCRMSSDDFFASNLISYDLIFIDGNHNEEQAEKDLRNSFAVLNPGGTIVMHDTLPPDEGHRHESKCGTVYRVADELRASDRVTLQTYTFPVRFGLTLVSRLP